MSGVGVVETVNTYPDLMVKLGLATPSSRAFVAGSVAVGLAYLAGYPKTAFRENGTLKPIGFMGSGPTKGTPDFLYLPVAVAAAAFLLT